jgi:hypothetical protein
LRDVFATGSSVFAVGGEYVYQLVAATWSKRTGDSPTFTTYSLSRIAGTASHAYALGRSHGLTSGEDLGYYWDGQSWTRHADPGDPEWAAVYADGDAIFGVSDESITNLADTTRVQGPGGTMRAAAGASGSIFVATSPTVSGQLYHGSNGAWTNDAGFGQRRGLFAIAQVDASVWFAGATGTVIEWAGGIIVHKPPTTRDVVAIAGTARDDVWIVDAGGNVYRFDGARWRDMKGPSFAYAVAIAIVDGEVVIAGRSVHRRANDTWIKETVTADSPSWLAAAQHAGGLYLVGTLDATQDVARIAHLSNGTWTELAAPPMERACGVSVAADDDIWVVGHDSASPVNGTVAHWDGTAWTAETLAAAGKLCAVERHGNEIWVSGNGAALHRRASSGAWTVTQPLAAGSIRALRMLDDVLWAVGDHGAVLRRE